MLQRILLAGVFAVASFASSAARAGADSAAGSIPASPPASIGLEERYQKLIEGGSFSKEEMDAFKADVTAAAAAEPTDVRWKIASAIIQRTTDAKGSVETFQGLAKAHPKFAEIQNQLGQSLMATMSSDMGFMKMAGVAGDAKDAWLAAIEIDPNHIMARYSVAQYEVQARKQGGFLFGSYKKARAQGEAILKIPGDKARFWGLTTLGSVAAAEEEWETMTKKFDAAEAIAPSDGLRNMVLSLHVNALVNDKKDPKTALPIVERAIASAPADNYSVYFLRGSVRKDLGDCPGAMSDFKTVLEKNADAQNTRFLLAQCCENTGDKTAAIAHYEEYVKRFPSGRRLGEAQTALKRLKKG